VDWPGVVRGFVIAFAMTGAPIFLHLASQAVALIFCAAVALVVARYLEQDTPIVIFVVNIFQNVFAALVSPHYSDFADIEVLKSYSLVTTAVCYLVIAYGFMRRPTLFSPFVRRMIYVSVAILAVVGVFFVLGLAINPRNATVYLRNIALPILVFQIFLIVGAKHRVPMPQIAVTLMALVMLCSYFELFWIEGWLALTNGWTYLDLFSAKRLLNLDEIKRDMEQGVVITGVLDYWRAALLNTTLTSDFGFEVQRLIGPNFNTISIAYFLAIFIAFLLAERYWGVSLAAFPLLLATSAKGPLALTVGCALFYFFARDRKSNRALFGLVGVLIVYAAVAFISGYRSGDFHVLGLLGGVNGFLSLPIGHTLGDGGNLSIPDFSALDWSAFQHAGAANVAVESAFGVLLYQLGVAAFALIGFYVWIAMLSWRLYRATGAPALAFATSAILICLVNGLYQEEAYFVPLSLPFLMGLVGLSLGATDRALAPLAAGKDDRARHGAVATPLTPARAPG